MLGDNNWYGSVPSGEIRTVSVTVIYIISYNMYRIVFDCVCVRVKIVNFPLKRSIFPDGVFRVAPVALFACCVVFPANFFYTKTFYTCHFRFEIFCACNEIRVAKLDIFLLLYCFVSVCTLLYFCVWLWEKVMRQSRSYV